MAPLQTAEAGSGSGQTTTYPWCVAGAHTTSTPAGKHWSQDLVLHPTTPDPLTLGWRTESDRLLPVLSKEPPASDAVLQLVRCNCGSSSSRVQSSSKTSSCRCSCRSSSLVCTELCNCEADEDECQNTQQPAAEEDSKEEWKASTLYIGQ